MMVIPTMAGVQVSRTDGAISYVGQGGLDGITPSTNVPVPWPVGTQAGDLGFVFARNTTTDPTISTPGWSNETAPFFGGETWWKVLSSGDLSATVFIAASAGNIGCFVFRNASRANNILNSGDPGPATSTVTWGGATKSGPCRALAFILMTKSASNTTDATIVSPSMSSLLYGGSKLPGVAATRLAYNLDPSEYVNSTAIQVSYGLPWDQAAIQLFELI